MPKVRQSAMLSVGEPLSEVSDKIWERIQTMNSHMGKDGVSKMQQRESQQQYSLWLKQTNHEKGKRRVDS